MKKAEKKPTYCNYPDCFNCYYKDCIMERKDIERFKRRMEDEPKGINTGNEKILAINGEKFRVRIEQIFKRDGEYYCKVKPVNFIGDSKVIRAELLS